MAHTSELLNSRAFIKPGQGDLNQVLKKLLADVSEGGGEVTAHAASHASGGDDEVSLDASQITAGTIDPARLGSGTPDSNTALMGNSTWVNVATQSELDTTNTNLTNHIADTVDAHDASAISYDPAASGLTATNVQAAIDELEDTVDSLPGAYTDEQAQDAVGGMVDGSLTYVDATPLLQRAALTGDVTAGAGSNATTIANNAVTTAKILDANVTLAKIANIADTTTLANNSGGAGPPLALTPSQMRTLLGLVIGTDVAAFGDARFTQITPNVQSGTTYTFVPSDAGKVVEGTHASAKTFTIDTFANQAIPVNSVIEVFQDSATQITIAAAGGVTLKSADNLVKTRVQNSTISLRHQSQNVWVLSGDLGA